MCEEHNKKILIIGSCELSKKVIEKILKKYKMKIADFVFIPYSEVKHFNFQALLFSKKYSDIFVGPTPHKARYLEGSTSPNQFLRTTKKV